MLGARTDARRRLLNQLSSALPIYICYMRFCFVSLSLSLLNKKEKMRHTLLPTLGKFSSILAIQVDKDEMGIN